MPYRSSVWWFSFGTVSIIFTVLSCTAAAQNTVTNGEYSAVFKGKIHYVDRQPAQQQIVEQASLHVSSSGSDVTIDIGQLGSAMSATRFRGTSGNSRFIAVHSVPDRENQTKVVWGRILDGNTLRGTLLYPRVADGLVPGYTELKFEARFAQGSAASDNTGSGTPTPRSRRPVRSSIPTLPSSSGAGSKSTVPSASSDSADGRPRKELKPRQPTAPTGSSVISGTLTGDIGVIQNIQLVDENENTLKTTTLDENGRYRFDNLGAARYWIYVNDGRAEAYITTTSGDISVHADGRSSYQVNFNVDN